MKKPKAKRIAAAFVLTLLITAFTACGKENYVAEYGIDGYVYLPKKISVEEGMDDLRVVGDYLYYMQSDFSINEVKRISLTDITANGDQPDFANAETLEQFQTFTFELTEGNGENGNEADFLSPLDGTTRNITGPTSREGLEMEYGRLRLEKYAVSPDGDLYCYLNALMGTYFSMDTVGGVLYRQAPEGGPAFRVYLPQMLDFAVDAEGRVLVLTKEEILVLDRNGNRMGEIPTDGYHTGGKPSDQGLFTDSEGKVYYTMQNEGRYRTTYEVEDFRLENAGGLLGEGAASDMSHSAAPDGNVFLFGGSEDFLYIHDTEAGTTKRILKWLECGLESFQIYSVAEITPDILLVAYSGSSSVGVGIYQLTKTSVGNIPEKELLVIASPYNSPNLQRAVIDFNAASDKYRVIVDSYGTWFSDEEMKWMCPQLDASLMSRNPPDLMDLDAFNIPKYARRGVLEDLSPYLEASNVLDVGNIQDKILEAMTFDGKLVCIPCNMAIHNIAVRASQAGKSEGWTMEDVYRFTEEHPECTGGAVDDGHGWKADRGWLLKTFCAPYCLEKFVDRENWTCSFDNDDFRRMVKWVGKYGYPPEHWRNQKSEAYTRIPDEVLMISQNGFTFTSLTRFEILYGEEARLLGYPTSDGRRYYFTKPSGSLGIISNSTHKEGAWEFLEYYLKMNMYGKAEITEAYEDATTPEYMEGTWNGEPVMLEKGRLLIGDQAEPYYVIPKEQADAILEIMEVADYRPRSEEEEMIITIVADEAESYYHGDKSLEEVARLIQNRVQLLLDEVKP